MIVHVKKNEWKRERERERERERLSVSLSLPSAPLHLILSGVWEI